MSRSRSVVLVALLFLSGLYLAHIAMGSGDSYSSSDYSTSGVVSAFQVSTVNFTRDMFLGTFGTRVHVVGLAMISHSVHFYISDIIYPSSYIGSVVVFDGVFGSDIHFDAWLTHGGTWYLVFDNNDLPDSWLNLNVSVTYSIETYQRPVVPLLIEGAILVVTMAYVYKKKDDQ